MACHSVQLRHRIFVKGYRFLSFAKNIGRNIVKNVSKTLSIKPSSGMLAAHQKRFDYAKQSATDALKAASKRAIQKATEANWWFIWK